MTTTTIWILVIIAIFLGIYDISVIAKYGVKQSISYLIYNLARQYPAIPFLIGFLMGHLFFPIL